MTVEEIDPRGAPDSGGATESTRHRWPPLRPNWPLVRRAAEGILGTVGSATAIVAILEIFLLTQGDIHAAIFILLRSSPLTVAVASFVVVAPLGVSIALSLAPRLLIPQAPDVAPDSVFAIRLSDYRRAADIVGASIAGAMFPWVRNTYFGHACEEADRAQLGDDAFPTTTTCGAVFTHEEALAVAAVMLVLGIIGALLFMLLASRAHRESARRPTVAAYRVARRATRVALVLAIVIWPVSAAGTFLVERSQQPPVSIVLFEHEYADSGIDAGSRFGWTTRWIAEGDGGYYFLPEDEVVFTEPDAWSGYLYEDVIPMDYGTVPWEHTGPESIQWRAGDPLMVVPCDWYLRCGATLDLTLQVQTQLEAARAAECAWFEWAKPDPELEPERGCDDLPSKDGDEPTSTSAQDDAGTAVSAAFADGPIR